MAMRSITLLACFIVVLSGSSLAQVCIHDICSYFEPHDCEGAWTYKYSTINDGVEMAVWFGSIDGSVQAATVCSDASGCELCFVYDDIDYTGDSVSAHLTVESCDNDPEDMGAISGTGYDCCDPNYNRVPLGWDVDDISIFDFVDDPAGDDDCYYLWTGEDDGYYYCRDPYDTEPARTALLAVQQQHHTAVGKLASTIRSTRDPPDFGVEFIDNCFFMMGLPLFCSIPTMNVCSSEPTVDLLTYLGIDLGFGDITTGRQSECADLSGTEFCQVIDHVTFGTNSVSYETHLTVIGVDVSGSIPLSFEFSECSCDSSPGVVSSYAVESDSQSESAAASGSAVIITAGMSNSNVTDGDGGDEDSGVNPWTWLWSFIVGAVLLCCCVGVGVVVALVIGGVLVFKKTTAEDTGATEEYDMDYA